MTPGYAIMLLEKAKESAKDEKGVPTDLYYALEIGIEAIEDYSCCHYIPQ